MVFMGQRLLPLGINVFDPLGRKKRYEKVCFSMDTFMFFPFWRPAERPGLEMAVTAAAPEACRARIFWDPKEGVKEC